MPFRDARRPTPGRVFAFTVTRVRGAYRHVAARRAVLAPLVRYSEGQAAVVQRQLDGVRRVWAAALVALHKAGWGPVAAERDLVFALNCPPFGVATADSARSCRRAHVCPFCYARERVTPVFGRFEEVLYGPLGAASAYRVAGPGSPALPVVRPDLAVVAFRMRMRGAVGRLEPRTVPRHWEAARAAVARTRRAEVSGFGAEFGSVLFQVYPSRGGLGVVRAGVLLAPAASAAAEAAAYAAAGGRARVLPANKKGLCAAFGWAYAYPKQLVDPRRAALTAALLTAVGRARLQTWYGPHDRCQKPVLRGDDGARD